MTATYEKLRSSLFVRTYFDDDAAADTARKIAWHEMGEHFLALLTFGAGTGVLTFKIFAGTSSVGANATVVKAHAGPTVADAANDQLVLEVSAEEVLAALKGAGVDTDGKTIYVAVEVDNDASSDENAVTYVISGRSHQYTGLTADTIA